jgi:hypothetical protein
MTQELDFFKRDMSEKLPAVEELERTRANVEATLETKVDLNEV